MTMYNWPMYIVAGLFNEIKMGRYSISVYIEVNSLSYIQTTLKVMSSSAP